MRIGHGFDVHKFGGEGPIVLGGVKIEYTQGFIAHSDGDVLLHAICDALLGAIGKGDIGTHFPDTDAIYENIDSRVLFRDVIKQVSNAGYTLGNLDCTIVAQSPKMAPHIPQMKQILAEDFQVDVSQLNIKATTTEKLGFTGRKEGIACHAVVLLEKKSC
ncbi:2-C-methyl-D-erythritol 2,4-cyclodiphosphate synthase [Algicola sagamiensis]|uniref:2-C-methyl-D-erythritol 2,4-cyclodiphosphate synthase n=1 Tax=Algicola sagamiensis TaxID=163869 RepID=UPI002480FB1C|nr:2-C-methyl-D-erythritol 2,4-cyclodiphosphate synthase [Algicola sagamiensis]